ncbi:MAG: hypothetical protein A2Y88_03025 [Chloroflexi bacterium RBG_13_48_10]|nr:MAG: hypothetical protein A2Y88_03025 [Chloroflexi bacterium RBG_13_48_10]
MLPLSACTSSPAEPSPASSMNQTGIAELDEIILVVMEGDTTGLRLLIRYTQTTCTFAEGLGGPPKCLEDEQEGTPVEVLPFLGPEGHFIRKADIDNWTGVEVSELYAVYQVSEAVYSDENYPKGEYALVFITDPEKQSSITLQVRQGRIVHIDNGYGYPPEIPAENVVMYLISPGNTVT